MPNWPFKWFPCWGSKRVFFKVAQENAEPEPQEPRPVSVKMYRNTREPLSPEEPPEPKTGTDGTVPPPNRNRTEPNRGHTDFLTRKIEFPGLPDLRLCRGAGGFATFGRLHCCQRTSARKTPANSTRTCPCQKLATHVQLWSTSSQPDFAHAVGEKQHEIARARFCRQSRSKVGQLLVNSLPTPHPMGSCRVLPCSGPLVTPSLRLSGRTLRRGCSRHHLGNRLLRTPSENLRYSKTQYYQQ